VKDQRAGGASAVKKPDGSRSRRSPSPRIARRDIKDNKAVTKRKSRSPTPEKQQQRRRSSPSPPPKRDEKGRDEPVVIAAGGAPPTARDRKSSPPMRERKASPPPKRICVRNLTRNVTKEHLVEIFAMYGALKTCEMPMDRQHSHLGRGYGYIEFETADDAEKSQKHMDGGQIDGQEISCEFTHSFRAERGGGGGGGGGFRGGGGRSPPRYRGGPPRYNRGSPPRYRGAAARSRSRSPRRRRSRS